MPIGERGEERLETSWTHVMQDVVPVADGESAQVLLEHYNLAMIPYVPFLSDRLGFNKTPGEDAEVALVVGDVDYNHLQSPTVPHQRRGESLEPRPPSANRREIRISWPRLPGTLRELETVSLLAAPRNVIELRGSRLALSVFSTSCQEHAGPTSPPTAFSPSPLAQAPMIDPLN